LDAFVRYLNSINEVSDSEFQEIDKEYFEKEIDEKISVGIVEGSSNIYKLFRLTFRKLYFGSANAFATNPEHIEGLKYFKDLKEDDDNFEKLWEGIPLTTQRNADRKYWYDLYKNGKQEKYRCDWGMYYFLDEFHFQLVEILKDKKIVKEGGKLVFK